MTDLYSAF